VEVVDAFIHQFIVVCIFRSSENEGIAAYLLFRIHGYNCDRVGA
jgi:hypothetical protein